MQFLPLIKISNNYYNFSPVETTARLSQEKQDPGTSDTKSIDSTNSRYSDAIDFVISAPPVKKLEVLLEKLRIQFYFLIFFGIVLTILVYLAVWSMSRCCALPFKENSCLARGGLPPTNHSTLAGEVDEFLVSAHTKISNLHGAFQMTSLTHRQKVLEDTKNDLWELIRQHSANLDTFGDIKKEDERMEELGEAVTDGYLIFIFISMVGSLYFVIAAKLDSDMETSLEMSHSNRSEELSAEESDNLQNVRLKMLKRRIPMFYLAIFTCFLVELSLYLVVLAGQGYAGSCPMYLIIEGKRRQGTRNGEKYLAKSFTEYYVFAHELHSTLDLYLEELNNTIHSPILEVRELGWKYEYNAIEAVFRHHTELKQQHVDRNTMPREISYAPGLKVLVVLGLAILINVCSFGFWMPIIKINNYYNFSTGESLGRFPSKKQEKYIAETKSTNSMDSHYSDAIDYLVSAPPLEKLDLLLKKLKVQFFFCLFGILLTIWLYTAVKSGSPCCELPFRENSCAARSVLPSTNHSTLSEEVDEFLSVLRVKTSNLKNAVEMPLIKDRETTLENTKKDFLQQIQQHSANLAIFGSVEREDEIMEKLELSVSNSYGLFMFFIGFGSLYYMIMITLMEASDKLFSSAALKELSAEGSDNLRNAQMKKLMRRIPIFYLAALLCFLVEFGLCASFLAGQYYTGSCPIPGRKTEKALKAEEKCLTSVFTDYHIFADTLQTTLDLHLEELNKSMQSPILEVRQLGWKYEYNAIEAALQYHSELKQYVVDRNVMPREISYAPRRIDLICLGLTLAVMILIMGDAFIREKKLLKLEGISERKRLLTSSIFT
ncbi:hypothetical protein Ddc_10211 [Ditylenchus destructor]|nr:hypothetical protein Ddc_10211 [Ditylenchus destructor]